MIKRVLRHLNQKRLNALNAYWRYFGKPIKTDLVIEKVQGNGIKTPVEEHWSGHTIGYHGINSAKNSIKYIKEIDRLYPGYFELCDLYSQHSGEIVVDYGCGPGNDLTGYYLYSSAKQIIGLDVSLTALKQARYRLALHGATPDRVRLIKLEEGNISIPLPDNSVDYIQSLGVLHHVSDPVLVLKELYRILKNGGNFRVMVYNHDSIYLHLTIPYELQIVSKEYQGMSAYQAFQTFGDNGAPICLCYNKESFSALASKAGFIPTYLGAAFSITELKSWQKVKSAALEHPKFPDEHQEFIQQIDDSTRKPKFKGHNAGIDAVFNLVKPV